MFGGILENITEEEENSAETHNYIAEGRYIESTTELTDIPEPTFSDPDANTIVVRDPELPKSDHIPGQYTIDGWYEELANKPPQ